MSTVHIEANKEKIAKCQKIADDLNVVLRVRPFEE